MARWLIYIGILLVLIGLVLHYVPGLFQWFGRLPGDIRLESGRTKVYIPITSMLLISVVLSLLIHILRRLF